MWCCPRGFQPLLDQCGCNDINECEQGLCDGICVATSGSFECYDDDDNDGISNREDNCQTQSNSDQADLDDDAIGDVCDQMLMDPSQMLKNDALAQTLDQWILMK